MRGTAVLQNRQSNRSTLCCRRNSAGSILLREVRLDLLKGRDSLVDAASSKGSEGFCSLFHPMDCCSVPRA